MATHLQELVRLPHPRRQALERDVHGWDRVAPEELRLVAFKHAERNAEQDVKSIEEQNVPHAEKRLKKNPILHLQNTIPCGWGTYLDGEAVSEEGEEPREADCGEVDAEFCEMCR